MLRLPNIGNGAELGLSYIIGLYVHHRPLEHSAVLYYSISPSLKATQFERRVSSFVRQVAALNLTVSTYASVIHSISSHIYAHLTCHFQDVGYFPTCIRF